LEPPLPVAALLLASLAGARWLSWPGIVYLGRISYGLYVFHTTGIWLVSYWWWPFRLPAAFALTLVAAALSYRFFECPFLRLKSHFTYVRSG
jgi:peptidoglycan/LPS O-acetylase OafA/YrhL